jgi:hypothetical protein
MALTQHLQPRPHFPSWRDVPTGIYATETQLKTMDLPRRPGPPAATVQGYDGTGRRSVLTLYRVDQSEPTAASAAQLAAARRRADPAARVCADCGARPDRALIPSETHGRLCPVCWHIAGLRHRQAEARQDRDRATATAAGLLHPGHTHPLTVLHIDYCDRGRTPSGTSRSPAAARITVLDATGDTLTAPVLRLVPARAKGVPADAGDPQTGAQQLKQLLADRTVVIWCPEDLDPLAAGLRTLTAPWPLPDRQVHDLMSLTAAWRSEVTPDGDRPAPVPPGRADRMLYLLRQIAGTAAAQPGGDQLPAGLRPLPAGAR